MPGAIPGTGLIRNKTQTSAPKALRKDEKKKKGKMKPTQEGMERDEGVTLETLYNKGSSEW